MFYKSPLFLFFIITVCLIGIYVTGKHLSPIKTNNFDDFDTTTKYLDSDPVVKQFRGKYEMYGKIRKSLDDLATDVDLDYWVSDGKGAIGLRVRTWAGIIISQEIACTPDSNDVEHTFYWVSSNILEYLQNYDCFEDKYP